MAKTKVKTDEFGLYVRAGGYVFRPIPCKYNLSGANPIYSRDGTSQFKVGQEVNAQHRGGTSCGSVKTNGIEELWFSHGCYYVSNGVTKTKPSDQCWDPIE